MGPKVSQYILSNDVHKKDAKVHHSIMKSLEDNNYDNWQKTVKTLESGILVANKDIPVQKEGRNLWFDKDGEEIISSGERLSYIASIEDDSYGIYKTETNEVLFIPHDVKKKQ